MILIVMAVLVVGAVPIFGGHLRRMGSLPIRYIALVWGAIIVQTLLVSGPWEFPEALSKTIHVATYGLAAAFAVANIRLPGVPIIGAGGAMNLAAILANKGVMPASAAAMRVAGLRNEAGFTNSGAVSNARLAWLGDVLAVPAGWPLANVFSIGDVVIVVGIGVLAHVWCHAPREVSPQIA